MHTYRSIGVAVVAGIICVACGEKHEPKTVAYYAEHAAERDARLAECRNNPGELKGDPDCVNAGAAVMRGWTDAKLPPITFAAPTSAAASR